MKYKLKHLAILISDQNFEIKILDYDLNVNFKQVLDEKNSKIVFYWKFFRYFDLISSNKTMIAFSSVFENKGNKFLANTSTYDFITFLLGAEWIIRGCNKIQENF